MTDKERAAKIAALNDVFRGDFANRSLGRTYITDGVDALGPAKVVALMSLVKAFSSFDKGNDPYNEHDFGSVTLDGERYFWKIDYYSKADPDLGSEDPSDTAVTERVLTIMRADEY